MQADALITEHTSQADGFYPHVFCGPFPFRTVSSSFFPMIWDIVSEMRWHICFQLCVRHREEAEVAQPWGPLLGLSEEVQESPLCGPEVPCGWWAAGPEPHLTAHCRYLSQRTEEQIGMIPDLGI